MLHGGKSIEDLARENEELRARLREETEAAAELRARLAELTERKPREAELEAAARLPQENPDAVMRLSQGRVISYANPAAQSLLAAWGCSLGQEAPAAVAEPAIAALLDGHRCEVECVFGEHTYLINLAPIHGAGHVNLYARDITGRKQAEENLRESEAKFRNLFENMTEEIHFWELVRDEQGEIITWRLVEVNPPALKTWGWASLAEIKGKTTDEIFGPGATEHYLPIVRKIMAEGAPYSYEDYFPNLGRHFRFTSIPLGNYFITTGADITERKQAEEALRESEDRLRLLGDNLPNSMVYQCIHEPDGTPRFLHVSAGVERLNGITAEAVIRDAGVLYRQFIPEDLDDLLAAERVSARNLSVFKREARMRLPDGRIRWMELCSRPRRLSNGSVIWDGVQTDITERKQAEEARRESEERYRVLAETMLQGVVLQDAAGTIIAMNAAAERILGRSPAEFLGSSSVDEEHHTLREDGTPLPGLEHPAMVALRTGQPIANVVMGVFNPREHAYHWIMICAVPVFRPGETSAYEVYAVFEDITERKQAEAQRAQFAVEQRRQREFLECLINNAGSCIAVLKGRELRYTLANPAFQKFTDVPIVGRTYRELFPEAAEAGAEALLQRVMDTGEPWMVETYHAPVPGKPDATWQGQIVRLPGNPGEEPTALAVVWDITERKRAERALRDSEERLHRILDANPMGAVLGHEDGRILYANDAYLRMVAHSREDLQAGRIRWDRITPPEYLSCDANAIAQAQATGVSAPYEKEYVLADGTRVPVLVACATVGNGELVAFVLDITERKRVEEALRESEGRLSLTLEYGKMGMWEWDVRANRSFWNPYEYELLGYPPGDGEVATDAFFSLVHPEDAPELERVLARVMAEEGFEFDHECRIRRADDGQERWIACRGRLNRDGQGQPERIIGVNYDITEKMLARQMIERHNQELERRVAERTAELVEAGARVRTERRRFLDVLETLPVIITLLRPDHSVVWVNQAYREALGANVGQLCYASQFGRDKPCEECQAFIPLQTGQPHNWQWTLPNGRTFDIYNFPFADADGSPMILEMDLDITERMQAEAALRDINETLERRVAERTAALAGANQELAEADKRKDEFLAMLAHELRNPLAPVRNAVQVIRLAGDQEDVRQRQQNIVDRQVTHMARLLDDLLDVSRITRGKITLRCQALDLCDVLADAVETTTPLIEARRHTLHICMPPASLRIEGDIDRLVQVVGNLLVNAAKYTDEGGQIWLSVSLEDGQAVVRVRDNGLGIAPELLPRVFDLFSQADHTLDRAQGGLGIGLTMVQNLVQMHGGTVEAHSAGIDQGSEFIVRLPALATESTAVNLTPSLPTQSGAGTAAANRILVVDDIADSAESLAELLALWGHETRAVYSGAAALEVARDFRPDVALLDIGMPGMDGNEVARRLRVEHGPHLMLVALTGYGQPQNLEATRASGFDHHLVKPVDLMALQAMLSSSASARA